MLTALLLVLLVCALFAYIPVVLVVIHSRAEKWIPDKYHQLKQKYWKTDYYGDSEQSIEQFEKELDKVLRK